MDKNKNYLLLKKFCFGLGLDLFGVADIESIKNGFVVSQNLLKKIDKAVSLGIVLSEAVLEDIPQVPTRLYFHHYRTANMLLDQLAFRVSSYIQKKGYFSLPIPASQIIDWQRQTAHLSHKKIGYMAGLGWIGRNNLLVNKNFGSQLRIVSILTNMPLKTDSSSQEGCGECRLCIDVCPAEAIKEDQLDFEHLKCFEKLKDFQKKRLVDQYICGVCVKVCRGKERKDR